jgi:hypothetical protein
VVVLAQDADTKKPIPGAEVWISYPPPASPFAPATSYGRTGNDGLARMQATPCGDTGIVVGIAADGYLTEEKFIPVESVAGLEPAHFFENVERRPASFVLPVYPGPHPSVELIVPAGYRGLIKAEVQIQEDAPCPPGQRSFSYPVSATGSAQVVGPVLLRRVIAPDFTAKFSDGTPLPREAKDAEVGFWWLRSDGNAQVFLVGTKSELDNYRAATEEKSNSGEKPSSPSKGKRGGGGRGGRRGGSQVAGDPSQP